MISQSSHNSSFGTEQGLLRLLRTQPHRKYQSVAHNSLLRTHHFVLVPKLPLRGRPSFESIIKKRNQQPEIKKHLKTLKNRTSKVDSRLSVSTSVIFNHQKRMLSCAKVTVTGGDLSISIWGISRIFSLQSGSFKIMAIIAQR